MRIEISLLKKNKNKNNKPLWESPDSWARKPQAHRARWTLARERRAEQPSFLAVDPSWGPGSGSTPISQLLFLEVRRWLLPRLLLGWHSKWAPWGWFPQGLSSHGRRQSHSHFCEEGSGEGSLEELWFWSSWRDMVLHPALATYLLCDLS